MEFDKSRVYSTLNADELKVGSKVIVAETLTHLKILLKERCSDFRKKLEMNLMPVDL